MLLSPCKHVRMFSYVNVLMENGYDSFTLLVCFMTLMQRRHFIVQQGQLDCMHRDFYSAVWIESTVYFKIKTQCIQ